MVELTGQNFRAMGGAGVWAKAKLTADAGFHTERNLEHLYSQSIDGYVADNLMRKRDPRFQFRDPSANELAVWSDR